MLSENKDAIMTALQKDLKMDPLVTNSEVTGWTVCSCSLLIFGQAAFKSVKTRWLLWTRGWYQTTRVSLPSWNQAKVLQLSFFFSPDSSAKIFKDPLGVVCLISPWNYPCSIIMRPLIGAVAAGNCVLLKPSEVSENTSGTISSRDKSQSPKTVPPL
jgi:hypothetical protein